LEGSAILLDTPMTIHAAKSSSESSPSSSLDRPSARGKFLFVGDEKLYVRGVTYGAFRPDEDGREYWDAETIDRDFAQMAANGINTVRIPHTMPPRSLLDTAQRHGLRVMVGLSAEQYVGFLIDKQGAPDVAAIVRSKVRECSGHPALLCYGIGNEIAAPLARWIGRHRLERYIRDLYDVVKSEDPGGLVSYVNYPSTEYLDLPFLGLLCFNVYLEDRSRYEAYLARLQNLAGDRPLLMTETGLDAMRNGEQAQADAIDWQIRSAFTAGCAGTFVFSWTDEWHRAGSQVDDWAFGVTDIERRPKPALAAISRAYREVPFPEDRVWPRVSVVVCSFNGARTIRDTLDALTRLDYPDYEVIVVNDGSTDGTPLIAEEYGFRVISTENRGLSNARNTGLHAATGEIVAYTDDDAYPDPHWLRYLADTFLRTDDVGVGGPNIPPPDDGAIAECVAHAPGGPAHVLVSDREAEHIPGCNMAFRREALLAIGGFDPRYRSAGDDVDICWRLLECGGRIGFNPAAMVWHHRRGSVRTYWRQQVGYGKAEALLEAKWPQRYNTAGHVSWTGRLYGHGLTRALGFSRARVYQGVWGSAPFQSLWQPTPGALSWLPAMPEWYLFVAGVAGLGALGVFWPPLLICLAWAGLALLASAAQAVFSADRALAANRTRPTWERLKLEALTALLHLVQPLARLWGRLRHGLSPWRAPTGIGYARPWPRAVAVWSERWIEPMTRLEAVEKHLIGLGVRVRRGGEYDEWGLNVQAGPLGAARMLMAVEDHGAGTQYVRIGWWPRTRPVGALLILLVAFLVAESAVDRAWPAAVALGVIGVLLLIRIVRDCSVAGAAIRCVVEEVRRA
jgi:O-antigen biosynthesis protein